MQMLMQQVWGGLIVCISNKLPGDANAASILITFGKMQGKTSWFAIIYKLFSLQNINCWNNHCKMNKILCKIIVFLIFPIVKVVYNLKIT